MRTEERSAFLLAEARARDPDRYLCALLAPPDRRPTLLALALVHRELARIPALVTQPLAGMIRLQWWRDAVDELVAGKPARAHPVVEVLAAALAAGHAAPATLHALIDGHQGAVEGIVPDPDRLDAHAVATDGELGSAWYLALGGGAPAEREGAVAIGSAFGLVELATAPGGKLTRGGGPLAAADAVPALRAQLLERARARLQDGRRLAGRPARAHMPAFLLARLAERYLRLGAADPTGAARRGGAAPVSLALRAMLRRP